jgi:hypothetical protein
MLGRCWNSPTESRSPPSRFFSSDSCSEVANATSTARSGSARVMATAAMVAAFAICSASRCTTPLPVLTSQPVPMDIGSSGPMRRMAR